jgi:hypothetical protein
MANDRDLSIHTPITLIINEIGTRMIMHSPARTGKSEPQPKPGTPSKGQTKRIAKIGNGRRLKAKPIFPNMVLVLVIMSFLILLDSSYRY